VNIRVTPRNDQAWSSGDQITIHYETQVVGGTIDATAGSDYTAIGNTQLIIIPESDGTALVNVPITILQDALVEGDEEFSITITAASINRQTTVNPGNPGLITIIDDDTATLPTLSINDIIVSEGGGSAKFTVTLSATDASDVTFSYSTADGTATGGSDYTISSGTGIIVAGDLTTSISITILDDAQAGEGWETFSVVLSNPSNATIGNSPGVATITDDDSGKTASINNASIAESDTNNSVIIKVIFSEVLTSDITFDYATTDNTATAPSDYNNTSTTATALTGTTEHNLTITIVGDDIAESVENFTVTISNITGGFTIADNTSVVTIFDNDSDSNCSSYVGLMTINEYQNNPHYFDVNHKKVIGNYVEIKYIDFLVKQYVTPDWKVQVYTTAGAQGILWKDRDEECLDERYEVFQFNNKVMGAQGYVVLTDENGNEVDVLNIDNSNHYAQSCQNFPYDTTFDSSAQNKDLFRIPDGTGTWYDTGNGANSMGSRCQGYVANGGVEYTVFEAIDIDEPLPNSYYSGSPADILSGKDTPIKTKIVNQPFPLRILWLNNSVYPTVLKTTGAIDINVYLGYISGGSLYKLPGANPAKHVLFNNNGQVLVTDFKYDRAIKEAVVYFEFCLNDENGTLHTLSTCTNNNNDGYTLTGAPSRNKFAIRPNKFDVAFPLSELDAPNLLRAGQEYNLTIHAPDYNGDDSLAYNQGEDNITISPIRYFADGTLGDSSLVGDLNWATNFIMEDGISIYDGPGTVTGNEVAGIEYSDVGLITIAVQDEEWAKVDALSNGGDTNDTTCDDTIPHTKICGELNATFIPHHFGFEELNITNHAGSDSEFTYIANKRGMPETNLPIRSPMAARIHTQIRALTQDGNITQNFREDFGGNLYYENNITVTQNVEMPTERNSTEPNAYIFGAGDDVNESKIDNKLVGFGRTAGAETDDPGTRNIKWDEDTYPLEFNFKREIQKGEDPFDVNGTYYSISLSSIYSQTVSGVTTLADIKGSRVGDDNATDSAAAGTPCIAPPAGSCENNNSQGEATFYYGRVRSSQFFYEDRIATANTDISINIYCNLGFTVCNNFGINTSLGQTDETGWWLSWDHNKTRGDGNVTLVVGDPLLKGSGSPTINTQTNPNHADISIATAGVNTSVIVAEGANPTLPMIVPIELVNNIEDSSAYYATTPPYTNRWLIYNEDTDSVLQALPSPFFKVEFIGVSGWAGHGDTGHVVDTDSSTKKNRRLGW